MKSLKLVSLLLKKLSITETLPILNNNVIDQGGLLDLTIVYTQQLFTLNPQIHFRG